MPAFCKAVVASLAGLVITRTFSVKASRQAGASSVKLSPERSHRRSFETNSAPIWTESRYSASPGRSAIVKRPSASVVVTMSSSA